MKHRKRIREDPEDSQWAAKVSKPTISYITEPPALFKLASSVYDDMNREYEKQIKKQ